MATELTLRSVLDLREWHRPVNAIERRLLDGLRGPVLEIGCGPGRLVAALARSGTPALGIDTSPLAAAFAADCQAPTVSCDVFAKVPDEGRWRTALVVDGSIGIGGDPLVLLRRVHDLLAPQSVALVEVRAPGHRAAAGVAMIEHDHGRYETIPWAELGTDQLGGVACDAGFAVERVRGFGGRWFGWLRSSARR